MKNRIKFELGILLVVICVGFYYYYETYKYIRCLALENPDVQFVALIATLSGLITIYNTIISISIRTGLKNTDKKQQEILSNQQEILNQKLLELQQQEKKLMEKRKRLLKSSPEDTSEITETEEKIRNNQEQQKSLKATLKIYN